MDSLRQVASKIEIGMCICNIMQPSKKDELEEREWMPTPQKKEAKRKKERNRKQIKMVKKG